MSVFDEYLAIDYNRSAGRARDRRISILFDISNFLASSRNLHDMLAGVLSRVLTHLGFDGGRIYLMEEGKSHLRLAAHAGIDPKGLKTVGIDEGFSGKTARTRSLVAGRVTDLEDRNRVKLLLGKGYEMIVCVPLIALDEVVGVMNLSTKRVIELDRTKMDLLMIVGNHIAATVSRTRPCRSVKKGKNKNRGAVARRGVTEPGPLEKRLMPPGGWLLCRNK
jgi:GAF domain-containing protein